MFNAVKFNITVRGTLTDCIMLGGILVLLGRKLAVTENNVCAHLSHHLSN